jgi:regulator of protease activity HflC (stomatin/prohibitin superfamily)
MSYNVLICKKQKGDKNLKRFIIVVACLALIACTGACTKVTPGYAGIKVNNYGTQKGVEDFPVVTGRVWYNPITTDLYMYPTFKQQVQWTKDPNEGSPVNQCVTFNSVEGAPIEVDLAVSYNIDAALVPSLFVEFRKPAEYITDVYLRNEIRDALSNAGSKMEVTHIYGAGKSELFASVTSELREKLGPKGIVIDNISAIGRLRFDPRVEQSINAVIEAMQRAKEAENKVAQSRAEADQKIETARGEAESMKTKAEGEAAAKLMVAKAEAEANHLVAASLSDELIRYHNVERWDGVLPKFLAGEGSSPSLLLSETTE